MSSLPVGPFPHLLARSAERSALAPLPASHSEPQRLSAAAVDFVAVSPTLPGVMTSRTAPAAASDVRRAWSYRARLPLTALCVVSGVALTVLSRPRLSADSPAGLALTGLGATSVFAGIGLRLWALASIGKRKTQQLVATGPYSLTRNPLYLGTLLIVLGFLGLWHSLVLALFIVPPILLYPFGVVPAEERILRARFGAEFEAYCARTPRWLPRLRGYVPEIHPATGTSGFRREVQCGLWWLFFAALTVAVVALRSA